MLMVSYSLQACYYHLDIHKGEPPMHQILKFEFPKLTGDYPVSKTTRHIIDTNRQKSHLILLNNANSWFTFGILQREVRYIRMLFTEKMS